VNPPLRSFLKALSTPTFVEISRLRGLSELRVCVLLARTHHSAPSAGSAPAALSSCPKSTPGLQTAPLPQARSPIRSPSPWRDSRRAPDLWWATTGPARTSLHIIHRIALRPQREASLQSPGGPARRVLGQGPAVCCITVLAKHGTSAREHKAVGNSRDVLESLLFQCELDHVLSIKSRGIH